MTTVVHLAAQAGVRYAVKNPGAYVHSNVAGFVTLMEEIVRMKRMPKVDLRLVVERVRVEHQGAV